MKKAFKTMLVASACMLIIPISTQASESLDGQVIDGSILTSDEKSEVTEAFNWNFNNEDEIMPYGSYYAFGRCGISKESSNSVYISASTGCYETCNVVKASVTLQQLKNGSWCYVTERSNTAYNNTYCSVEDYIHVNSGYYYRVISTHSATKNGKTETGAVTSNSLYVN